MQERGVAVKSYNTEHGMSMVVRQVKYLDNIVEQDPRGVKRVTRPMVDSLTSSRHQYWRQNPKSPFLED